MALVASSLTNLIGGVSQQPSSLRLSNAHEELVNTWPSLVTGLQKRAPTELVAKLGTVDNDIVAGHVYNDAVSGQTFFVMVKDDEIRVFNADGDEKTVNGTLDPDYMDFDMDARSNCQMLTIGDTTFVLNKIIPVTTSAISEAGGGRVDPTDRWTIHVREAVPNAYYTIYVNGSKEAEFLTDTNQSDATAVESTSEIATEIYNDLDAAGFTCAIYNSTIALTVPSGQKVQIYSEGKAGESMAVFNEEVYGFSDLPPQEEEGRVVKVIGNPSDEGDDYFVQFNAQGRWVETYGYGEGLELDTDTMPYFLVYNQGTDEFSLSEGTWDDRIVGNDVTSPAPSFVGNKINSMFLEGGRLGFLADENVIMSEADNRSNFWRTSVVQLLDADPIDIGVVSGRVTIPYHTAPFNKTTVLFSDLSQYILDGGEILSPKTTSAKFTTSFPATTRLPPINVGPYVYFVDDSGSYLRLLEFFTDNVARTENADDVSVQVPEYIKGPIRLLVGSNRTNTILMQGDETDTLYTYRFSFGAESKLFSSWGKWTFSGDVMFAWFTEGYLYLFINYSDGLYLERMKIEEDVVRTKADFPICLDHTITLADTTAVYDSETDLTTITLPHAYPSTVTLVTAPASAGNSSGVQYEMTNTTGNDWTVQGDVTAETNAAIGIPYTFRWKFSTQYLRESNRSGGETIIQDGRLSLRYLTLHYKDTSAFSLKVTLQGNREFQYDFYGRILGSADNILGEIPITTGTFRRPIMGENKFTDMEVINDTPYHCTFTAAEWQAQWRPKAVSRA